MTVAEKKTEIQEYRGALKEEVSAKQKVETELESLKNSRYVIKQGSLGTLSERRLRDIEFELFASLQEVNMEKGRREIMNFLRQ